MSESTVLATTRLASGQRTLLLGIATLVCALTDGVIIATYTGPALVPDRLLAVLLAVLILFVLTVVSFALTVNEARHRIRNIVGFVLGPTAVPVTCVLLTVTYTVLQEVFHLSWYAARRVADPAPITTSREGR